MKQEESTMKNIIGGVVFVTLWFVRGIAIVLVWMLLLGVILFGAATGRKYHTYACGESTRERSVPQLGTLTYSSILLQSRLI